MERAKGNKNKNEKKQKKTKQTQNKTKKGRDLHVPLTHISKKENESF